MKKICLTILRMTLLVCCTVSEVCAQSHSDSAAGDSGLSGLTDIYEYFRDSVLRAGGSRNKLRAIREGDVAPVITLTEDALPAQTAPDARRRDTTVTVDAYGRESFLMRAVRDEKTGEMVANEVIDAAVVSARFRNVAERHGKVALQFDITVPRSLMDSKWQLQMDPDMYVLGDSIRLDRVVITGRGYRKAQLKGYQHYERFLSKIVQDTAVFVNIGQLELFIERNMPQLYAFKHDSTEVSHEQFYSYYGVNEAEAIEHYTDKLARMFNEYRKGRRQKMFERYVRAPIVTEGVRLDTVLVDMNGDFRYRYTQVIDTRPGLRKVDIVLSGAICGQDRKLYSIPRGEPLSFYVSSVSMFADMSERYLTKVVERKVTASSSYNIVFQVARADVRYDLGGNAGEIDDIKRQLASLMDNETYALDSIKVTATASPEGSFRNNERLSRKRSEAVTGYFREWMDELMDSLTASRGFNVDVSGEITREHLPDFRFSSSVYAENWEELDRLVRNDSNMSDEDKLHYYEQMGIGDPDEREARIRSRGYYRYLKEELYPELRTVTFDFYLHRKQMAKDTVHTTVLDTTYMRGVEAIRDRDYEAAAALLAPYHDYNTAVAYVALDRNRSALEILKGCEKTAQVNYMLALVCSRMEDETNAVQYYLASCRQDPSFVHRGNLDPEISALIASYGLNDDDALY